MKARDRILWLLNFAGGMPLSSAEISMVTHVGSWRFYPLMAAMERDGLIEGDFQSGPYPRRRRYILTAKGEQALPEAAPLPAVTEGKEK